MDEYGNVDDRFQVPRTVAHRFGYTMNGEEERGQEQVEEEVEEEAEEEEVEERAEEEEQEKGKPNRTRKQGMLGVEMRERRRR